MRTLTTAPVEKCLILSDIDSMRHFLSQTKSLQHSITQYRLRDAAMWDDAMQRLFITNIESTDISLLVYASNTRTLTRSFLSVFHFVLATSPKIETCSQNYRTYLERGDGTSESLLAISPLSVRTYLLLELIPRGLRKKVETWGVL